MPQRLAAWLAAGLLALAGSAAVAQQQQQQQQTLEPNNSLERHLRAVQAGEREVSSFVEELVESQVVLLSKREVVQMDTPGEMPALVLPNEDGDGHNLAVFTSPELAHRVARTYPEYRFGVETEFLWVLAHTAPGLGVAVNPGWTLGMKIPSYGLLRLRERYQDRIESRLDTSP